MIVARLAPPLVRLQVESWHARGFVAEQTDFLLDGQTTDEVLGSLLEGFGQVAERQRFARLEQARVVPDISSHEHEAESDQR